ncbi:hypothetical protein GW17_00056093 [Ensete ventricosum]|nr:hypothetical protein GW17_00056093 [Ensete ventricosum]
MTTSTTVARALAARMNHLCARAVAAEEVPTTAPYRELTHTQGLRKIRLPAKAAPIGKLPTGRGGGRMLTRRLQR